jgi:tripartite-type tricarboxylate transporter receptor subunit TctC/NAD(P)-dependent dehydrogenase (short-subunit alcohol dehydrogenase family)
MDLGIRGKTALVCAASKGLGKGCALALAREGVNLVITARGADALEATAAELHKSFGVDVKTIPGDITTAQGREAALRAAPAPDILVNNAGGPPPGDFREWDRETWVKALDANMITPILMIRAVVDGMIARKFGRIVNITSGAVKAPIPELGLSNGARTGLTGFIAGLSRTTVRHNVTINNLLTVRDRPAARESRVQRQKARQDRRRAAQGAHRRQPCRALRYHRGVRRRLRLFVWRSGGVHHGTEPPHGRWTVSGHVLECRIPRRRIAMRRVFAALAAVMLSGAALAQAYPNRPVKVVVPWPPGQATDIAARVVAERLQAALGQPFVVENRPGAGGAIGTNVVVKSAADGYTILAASSGPLSIMPNLQKTPYDPLKDLAPVSLICMTPFALVAHPSFPAANAKEFVAMVKAKPGNYTFASSGTGATAHLFAELFNSMAGIQARHVPYKGSAPALTDVMNGSVSYAIETVAATQTLIKSGKLKAFGVTTARRTGAMPELPPLAEAAGVPGYDAAAWIGYAAPAGTPREVLTRISGEMQKLLATEEIKARLVSLGLDAQASTPDEMAAFMRREQERYAAIIKAQNIKVEQ